MKIKYLIELLKKFPEDEDVIIEGCDCYGTIDGAVFDSDFKKVVITRDDGSYMEEREEMKR